MAHLTYPGGYVHHKPFMTAIPARSAGATHKPPDPTQLTSVRVDNMG